MKFRIIRVLLLPAGLAVRLFELALAGARDLHNRSRFRSSIVDPGCRIDPGSSIGESSHILSNSLVINSRIGRFSYVGCDSIVQNCSIGSFCSIGREVFIGLGAHPLKHFTTSPLFYRKQNTFRVTVVEDDLAFPEYKKVEIGNDVWIGARAMLMDGVRIGHGAVVASGAVVTRDVEPYSIVGGVPAKVLGARFEKEKVERLVKAAWWNLPIGEIVERSDELNRS